MIVTMPFSHDEELAFLRESVELYAPSWQERPVVDLLARIFADVGIFPEIDDKGNARFTAGSGHPFVLLASHMDTIASPLDCHEDDCRISGRGAVDCRSSLLAMALAMHRIVERGFTGTVQLGAIVAEETSLDGIDAFLDGDSRPDMAIFGEPTTTGKICIAYKGRVWARVTASASPGHVAAAWILVNPIEAEWAFYQNVQARLKDLVKGKELAPFYTPIAVMTTLNAGSISNMTPESAVADIDIRFPPGIKKDTILDAIEAAKQEIATMYGEKDPAFSIDVSINSSIDGIHTTQDGRLCIALAGAIEAITGNPPGFVRKTGTTFMNNIGTSWGCEIVTYGPGDPRLEHTREEAIDKQEFLSSIDILEQMLATLLT